MIDMSSPSSSLESRPAAYDSHSIVILSGVDAIRKRPALYIGSTDSEGLHRLVFELIENSVDEFLADAGRRVVVRLHEDGSCSVSDDGRGIPISMHPSENRPSVEVLLTRLHSGAKFSSSAYGFSAGLHGLGLTSVNALSEWVLLEVSRDGKSYRQEFRRGVPQYDLKECGLSMKSGTMFRFLPDSGILGAAGFSYGRIAARLRELSFLNAGLQLRIEDLETGRADEYCSTTGIRGLLDDINRTRGKVHAQPVWSRTSRDGAAVEVALQWTPSFDPQIASYVNSVHTSEGGTHVEGLERGILRVLRKRASESPYSAGNEILLSDVLEGLTAVIAVGIAGAEFDSQIKKRLVKSDVADVIEEMVAETLEQFLEASPQAARAISERVGEARRARLAARGSAVRNRYVFPGTEKSLEVYRKQFGIRSKNWHESCRWLTDPGLLNAHASLCEVPAGARMLDVCCGSGIVGASFGDRVSHKMGLDITPEMRKLASTRLNEVREGSVYDIPFPEGSFDVVVTREVIHLLPEPHRPLREILRVLRPGGQMIMGQTVPYGIADAAWTFQIFYKKQPLFCNNFLAEDLAGLFSSIGFDRVESTEYLLWEPIDLWIDTHETTSLHRQEIRELYYNAPAEVREIHPFEVTPDGKIRDQWRWVVFSARKPE